MEKPATDIYTFENLRREGFTYVDKTALILPLVDMSIGKQFFMARPRRFGKSLLISTMRSLFEGRRDLFTGLDIESKWDWRQKWPVLHLDMGSCQGTTVEATSKAIGTMLEREATRLGVKLRGNGIVANFSFLIDDLAQRDHENRLAMRERQETPSADAPRPGQMVLLVDEYDKPLLNHLGEPDVNEYRDLLKQFYSVIKTLESKQRFTFITGVSKFSKVSIFSDLNNLIDFSMGPNTATLLGYTHDELRRFFPETIQKIATANGLTADAAFARIIEWYDGYRFHPQAEKVINPVSFGLCAKNGEFQNYWANTATPTFLIEALKKTPLDFSTIDIDQSALEAYEPANLRVVTLLFQTGYLTIKGCHVMGSLRTYDLVIPNLEVENSFLTQLAPVYAGLDDTRSVNYQIQAAKALYADDVDKFIRTLKNFFANIPYDLTDRQNEQMWQAIVYVILKAIGVAVNAEVKTNEGRIDMTCATPTAIWLIEFKLDHTAAEALAQINAKDYAAKYDMTGKKVIKIGVGFSSEKRTITDVAVGSSS